MFSTKKQGRNKEKVADEIRNIKYIYPWNQFEKLIRVDSSLLVSPKIIFKVQSVLDDLEFQALVSVCRLFVKQVHFID